MKRRPSAAVTRVALALVAVVALGYGSTARAQSSPTPSLGGYQGLAQTDGMHVFYNPEGLLPITAPVDFGAPDAYATIAAGPATFARASAADPGDLLANPDALLAAGASGWKAGTIPAYPYRATAGSGIGEPDAESTPAPGLVARVHADGSGSAATSTMPGAATPAIATVGSMASTATTSTDGSTVSVHAHSEISDFDLLGVVHIGSVVTDLTATSDGTTTSTSGGTVVNDASVAGTPVTIDNDGVHPTTDPNASTTTTNLLSGVLPTAVGNLNDLLKNAGITIAAAGPLQQGDQNDGQLTAYGLHIGLEVSDKTYPVLGALLDAVPYLPPLADGAPSAGDLIELAKARHLVGIDLGRGVVNLSARPSHVFIAGSTAPTSGTAGSPGRSPSTGAASRPAGKTGAGTPAAATPAGAPAAVAMPAGTNGPAAPIGYGIAALALLALIAQPFIGDRLGRAASTILAGDAGSCPWEQA